MRLRPTVERPHYTMHSRGRFRFFRGSTRDGRQRRDVTGTLEVGRPALSSSMWVDESIVPVSRGYGDVQPGATLRGPESRSVQPALRPGPRGSLFVTGPKGDGNRRTHRHSLRHSLRHRRRQRIIGPRQFWRSCVLAFLRDCGLRSRIVGGDRPGNGVLPHREDRSTDGGIADSSRRKTPLVLPCEGRDAGARVVRNLREQGLSLVGGRAHNLRVRVLSLVGGRRSSSGERQRGSCEATEGAVKGSRLAMGPSHSPPWAPPCTVTAALFAPPRLDAPVPPVISKKPRQQEAASHPYTCDLSDTQREKPRIPPQRSGGDRCLPDRCLPDLQCRRLRFTRTARRRAGARTRPRTPVVFLLWST